MTLPVLRQLWAARSAGEQWLLLSAGIAVLIALIYGSILRPGLAERQKLSAALPRIRADLEDMRAQQKEIGRLRQTLKSTSRSSDVKALLQSSLAQSALGASVERVEATSANRAFMRVGAVEFTKWLDWVERVQREFGIRVAACEITALDRPGFVRVEVTFESSGPPPERAS